MRSPSVLISFVTCRVLVPFAQSTFLQTKFLQIKLLQTKLLQTMAERDALVEHEAFAAPAALGLRHLFQIFENAALEVIDLGKAAREQMRARLLAANAAGAEHRDFAVFGGIELLSRKILELAKTPDARIERAVERPHRHLEGVPGVEHQRIGRRDERVPFARIDIGADLPRRI